MNLVSFSDKLFGRHGNRPLVRNQEELDAAIADRQRMEVPRRLRKYNKYLIKDMRDYRWPLKVDIRSDPSHEITVGPNVMFHAFGRSRVAFVGADEERNMGYLCYLHDNDFDGVADDASVVRVFDGGRIFVAYGCAARVEAFGRSVVVMDTYFRRRKTWIGFPDVTAHDHARVESKNAIGWEGDITSDELRDAIAGGRFSVRAFDRSLVKLRRLDHVDDRCKHRWISCRVNAFGNSRVWAFGNALVYAYGSSKIHARDDSVVDARGSCVVDAYDCSRVSVFESAKIKDHRRDPAVVRAMNFAKFRAKRDAEMAARIARIERAVVIARQRVKSARAFRSARKTARAAVAVC